MNILIDLRPLMAGNISGVEVYLKSLLAEFLKNDSQNHYILWWNSHHNVSHNIPQFKNKNITYISTKIPNKILNLSLSFLRYPKIDQWIGKKIGIKIDCVFVPDPRPTPISQQCNKILTIHDLSFEHYKKTFSWKTRFWHKILKPKKEAHEANKIIAVSEATKHDLVKTYKIHAEKIKVIYEASNIKIDKKNSPPYQKEKHNSQLINIQKKYNLPPKFILTLSTIEPRKNIERLLEAFDKLKQTTNLPHKLVIAGKRNEKIFAKVKSLNANKNVIFTGFIDEKDKAFLYILTEAFVYPSLFEGFGLPLVEAMQMGCPVITSNLSSMPEIVQKAGQLVNPYDINSIQKGLEFVLENENLRKQMQEKSLKRAKDFSWKKCAEQTLEILNSKLKNF